MLVRRSVKVWSTLDISCNLVSTFVSSTLLPSGTLVVGGVVFLVEAVDLATAGECKFFSIDPVLV